MGRVPGEEDATVPEAVGEVHAGTVPMCSIRGSRQRSPAARRIRRVIDRVAAMAGVARSTVYAIFGSRAGLFDAVGVEVFEHAGYGRVIEAARQPDAREHLRDGLRAATEMFAADRDVVRALHSMAQLDQQAVGGAVERWESERAAGMARLARRLQEQGALRAGIGAARAEHVLWVLTSFEAFDLLFSGRGLAADAVADLLIEAAEDALLP
jgi:AcrR family transcriptional regulator